jgi:hypothetical protein
VAENSGNAEPIADAALGGEQVDPRAEAFEWHVLGPDDHGDNTRTTSTACGQLA